MAQTDGKCYALFSINGNVKRLKRKKTAKFQLLFAEYICLSLFYIHYLFFQVTLNTLKLALCKNNNDSDNIIGNAKQN